jgi:cobalt-precorrin 5A hydrolase/precorrin-3B C17-methyltransferase
MITREDLSRQKLFFIPLFDIIMSCDKEVVLSTAIFYITENGLALAKRLQGLCPGVRIEKFNSKEVRDLWHRHKNLIFIMASGIVVRTIAPLIKDKKTDPAVIVLDENGKYTISLLSGHLGGGNKLAKEIADFLKGQAIITTASDANSLPSIDLWAKDNDMVIENWDALPHIATRFLNTGELKVYAEVDMKMPQEFTKTKDPESADVVITNKQEIDSNVIPVKTGIQKKKTKKLGSCSPLKTCGDKLRRNDKKKTICQLYLRPKNLIIGIGCNRGTSANEIEDSIKTVLNENNLSFLSIHSIVTIDIKGDEKGLKEFSKKYDLKINTYTSDELNAVVSLQPSAFSLSDTAFKATGAYAVAEPAALLSAGSDKLLVSKQKIENATIAVAELECRNALCVKRNELKSKKDSSLITEPALSLSKCHSSLYIVGTGPGSIEHITPYAQDVIRKSDVIVGYGTYLGLIQELIKDKEVVSTGMTQEIDRCKKAVEIALSGKTVSVISGGDPGIYAMAGLVFEVLRGQGVKGSRGQEINKSVVSNPRTLEPSHPAVEVIPGISALNACASRLGAPLMHDFAVISLSDRLTPWDLIEKRLAAAAMADFVTVLYNPKSIGRQEHINKARAVFLRHRSIETPVGIVKGAMRENERIIITNLRDMLNCDIDMQATVIIGNSQTFIWKKWMITPRGYENKK